GPFTEYKTQPKSSCAVSMTVWSTGFIASRRHTNRNGRGVLAGSSMVRNFTSSAGTDEATDDSVNDAPMPTPTSSITVQESGTVCLRRGINPAFNDRLRKRFCNAEFDPPGRLIQASWASWAMWTAPWPASG